MVIPTLAGPNHQTHPNTLQPHLDCINALIQPSHTSTRQNHAYRRKTPTPRALRKVCQEHHPPPTLPRSRNQPNIACTLRLGSIHLSRSKRPKKSRSRTNTHNPDMHRCATTEYTDPRTKNEVKTCEKAPNNLGQPRQRPPNYYALPCCKQNYYYYYLLL